MATVPEPSSSAPGAGRNGMRFVLIEYHSVCKHRDVVGYHLSWWAPITTVSSVRNVPLKWTILKNGSEKNCGIRETITMVFCPQLCLNSRIEISERFALEVISSILERSHRWLSLPLWDSLEVLEWRKTTTNRTSIILGTFSWRTNFWLKAHILFESWLAFSSVPLGPNKRVCSNN
jgi:hypothetical protein